MDAAQRENTSLRLPAISADSDWPADVVEDNSRIGKRAREILRLVDLRMIEPSVEGKAEAAEHREPFAKCLIGQQSGRRLGKPDWATEHPRPRP